MADMTSGLVGFFSSTILIVIFGEIIPQAACSRYALMVGYYTRHVVRFFIAIFYPFAFPLGWCLDKALGDDLGMQSVSIDIIYHIDIAHIYSCHLCTTTTIYA